MPSFRRPYPRAVSLVLALLLLGSGVLYAATRSGVAHAASISQLQNQISSGQSSVSSLSGAVNAASGRLNQLDASIAALQQRITRIQADLNAKRAELLKLRTQLDAARTRLAQLEAFESRAESVLSKELVNAYESDRPDLVSVVLEATGFQDLLERIAFMQRIQKQDVQVVSQVKAARRAVAAQAIRLGALELRQQQITTEVLAQRNSLAGERLRVVQQQIAVAQLRDQKAGQLAGAKAHLADLNHQLAQAQAAQAAAAAAAAAKVSSSSGFPVQTSGFSGPSSGGGFTFPLPKNAVSPPSTWSLDQGVDMAAPGDTPEYAVCSGTIVLHGIGGFGPWAPVLHCDSPLGGYSYVYYGHAGPNGQLPVGTHVGAGQVMSSVGPGIVGMSTGPHIEIGFADAGGSPVGGASTMYSLLQGAYG